MPMSFLLDGLGLAASVSSVRCGIWPLCRRSMRQVQTNRVKSDVVDSKLRFNCVSTGQRLDRWSGRVSGYYRRHDNALLGLSCATKERSATAGCGDVKKQSRLGEV